MREAVIVSTARTPLTKAHRGNSTSPRPHAGGLCRAGRGAARRVSIQPDRRHHPGLRLP